MGIRRHWNHCIQEETKQNLQKTAFKIFEVIWSAQAGHITSNFLKAAFHNFFVPFLNTFSHRLLTRLWHYFELIFVVVASYQKGSRSLHKCCQNFKKYLRVSVVDFHWNYFLQQKQKGPNNLITLFYLWSCFNN